MKTLLMLFSVLMLCSVTSNEAPPAQNYIEYDDFLEQVYKGAIIARNIITKEYPFLTHTDVELSVQTNSSQHLGFEMGKVVAFERSSERTFGHTRKHSYTIAPQAQVVVENDLLAVWDKEKFDPDLLYLAIATKMVKHALNEFPEAENSDVIKNRKLGLEMGITLKRNTDGSVQVWIGSINVGSSKTITHKMSLTIREE